MFTVVVLLQLVGEGRVQLGAPLERYVSTELVPAAERITVRMLLQHTSGLHDAARDLPRGAELVRTRFRHYDTATLVREAAARPAEFPPGTDYGYSTTNYLIAGLIIERVAGCSYAEEVKRRIIAPLRLRDTPVPGDTSSIPGPHAHGYLTLRGTGDRPGRVRQVDVSELNPSMAGPAGEIVMTTRDLDTFLTSLTSGKLLHPAEWEEMNRTVSAGGPGSRYGLGLKQERLSCGRLAVGHTGGTFRRPGGLVRWGSGLTRPLRGHFRPPCRTVRKAVGILLQPGENAEVTRGFAGGVGSPRTGVRVP